MIRETVVRVLPASDPDSRLVIAVEQPSEGGSQLVLRQETRADRVGWFVQSRVAITPEQVTGLREMLAVRLPAEPRSASRDTRPTILSFTEAAGQVG